MSRNITVIAERNKGWWVISTPEIPGLFTQARRLDQIEHMVRDAAEVLDEPVDDIEIKPILGEEDTTLLHELLQAKEEARQAQEHASTLAKKTIDKLRSQGLSVRDVATVVGVSPQRISAISSR